MCKAITILGFILILAAGAGAADSPIDKGSLILGGQVSFQSQSAGGTTITQYSISPGIGYFIRPKTMVGINIAYQGMTYYGYTRTNFSVAPQIGFYLYSGTGRAEARGAVYSYIKLIVHIMGGNHADTDAAFGGALGMNYMLSNTVAADLALELSFNPYDTAFDSGTITTIWIGVGITAFIY